MTAPEQTRAAPEDAAVGPLFSHDDGSFRIVKEEPLPQPFQPSPSETDALGWQALNAVVESGKWVRVRVQGGWTLEPNPEYRDNPAFHCDTTDCFPKAGETIGAAGGAGLNVTVAYQSGEPTPLASGADPGPALEFRQVDATTIEALWDTSRQINFWVKRAGGEGGWWDGRWILKYLYSGGPQTVTVTEVPRPLRIRADQRFVTGGTTVNFTAEVDGVLDLSTSGTPIINWTWSTGDTLATPGKVYVVSVSECGGKLTCAYTLWSGKSGRMWATASVEGRSATNHSEIVWVGKKELILECAPDPVMPGESVSCAAGTSPTGGNIETPEWTYSGSTTSPTSTSSSWTFQPASSGVTTVNAIVDGVLQTASDSVAVANPELHVTCSPGAVIRGDSIACTASVSPAGTPWEVINWTFSGGSYYWPGPNGVPDWIFPPPVSGDVIVRAMVDGVEMTARASVSVEDCEFGDPLLDDPKVQEGF